MAPRRVKPIKLTIPMKNSTPDIFGLLGYVLSVKNPDSTSASNSRELTPKKTNFSRSGFFRAPLKTNKSNIVIIITILIFCFLAVFLRLTLFLSISIRSRFCMMIPL